MTPKFQVILPVCVCVVCVLVAFHFSYILYVWCKLFDSNSLNVMCAYNCFGILLLKGLVSDSSRFKSWTNVASVDNAVKRSQNHKIFPYLQNTNKTSTF